MRGPRGIKRRKGRQRRLKHFDKRAEAFARDLERGKGYKQAELDGRSVRIGAGQHKRLIKKRWSKDLDRLRSLHSKLKTYLQKQNITQQHYSLVQVRDTIVRGIAVQEYFHKPSLYALTIFLKMKKDGRKSAKGLNRETELLCRQFMGQHKGITLKKIEQAGEELRGHLLKVFKGSPAEIFYHTILNRNLIILGQNTKKQDKRIRIAIVDV